MIACVGFDHTSTDLAILEKVALRPAAVVDALGYLVESDNITETVVVSTCMRTEIYLVALRFHPAIDHAYDVLAKLSGLDRCLLAKSAVEKTDDQAVGHLFSVAAGLQSAVLGEHEILGQVSRSWETAKAAGASRMCLNPLFMHATRAGRRARKETAISHGTTSIGQAAVAMAESRLGDLGERRVLITGAGEMGAAMGIALTCAKQANNVAVCNRTKERAVGLAKRIGAEAVDWNQLATELQGADFWLTSTNAESYLMTVNEMRELMSQRNNRELFVVDMGLPRDVDPRAEELPGVTLLNIDDLRSFTEATRNERGQEVRAVEDVVASELKRYSKSVHVSAMDPVLRRLYETAEEIREQEVARFLTKQSNQRSLSQSAISQTAIDEDALNSLTRGIVAKLMHKPVSKIKASGGTPEGERLHEALRLLFDS